MGDRSVSRVACVLATVACFHAVAAQEPPLIEIPPASGTLASRQFSMVRAVRELADGRILVSDPLEKSVYVVDLRTGDVRSIGSVGDGPGEYSEPGFLFPLAGDSTLLTDPMAHRLFLLVGDSLVRTFATSPLAELVPGSLPEGYWGADRFGRVLAAEGYAYDPEVIPMSRVYADSIRLMLTTASVFGIEPLRLDTIADVGGQGRWGVEPNDRGFTGLMYHTSPLASEGQAWLFADGWVALAHPDPYRVDWRTPEGTWRSGASLPFTRRGVNQEEKCHAMDRRFRRAEGGDCRADEMPGWPDVVPPFVMEAPRLTPGGVALRAAPDGMLLVRRTPTVAPPGRRYDVVDRSAGLRGAIALAANQAIVGFGRSSLYVVEEDDDTGLLTLSRHPWPAELAVR